MTTNDKAVLKAAMTIVERELADSGEVSIYGFGRFKLAERTFHNPSSGMKEVAASVRFKAVPSLKARARGYLGL